MKPVGGMVARVSPGSIAEELELKAGDHIISINGHVLHDVIDYRFYGAEEHIELLVRRGDEEMLFVVERDYDEELGLEFAEPTFDGIRRCVNHCSFCFIKGMPPGLRPSLYVRDDDYRYSFLFGNFITLTNLSEADWARIAEQHLSPLYISVHATDEAVRRRLLGNPNAPDILPQLRHLRDIGVEMHTQVVLMPGQNDDDCLRRTVSDLARLWPAVRSLGIVPVGLTRFQRGCGRVYRAEEAEPLLDTVAAWQKHYRRQFGLNWVYAADEWYLLAGRPVPSARAYDGFPQLENGIGLVRILLDDWARARRKKPPKAPSPVTLVCGTLVGPLLRELGDELAASLHSSVSVLPVTNRFFGEQVTVSGLLTGHDVRTALQRARPAGRVFLPRAMFDDAGRLTLDDFTTEEIAQGLDARIDIAETLSQVIRAMS